MVVEGRVKNGVLGVCPLQEAHIEFEFAARPWDVDGHHPVKMLLYFLGITVRELHGRRIAPGQPLNV